MIKNILLAVTMLISIVALSVSVSAHHSAAAQFDVSKEFVLTGVLTELKEVNPHSIWHVDVKGEDGKVTSWKLEGVSPNNLRRLGLSIKNDLKIGVTCRAVYDPAYRNLRTRSGDNAARRGMEQTDLQA